MTYSEIRCGNMSKIKELREKNQIGQKVLAAEIGVSQPTVCAWENGAKTPSSKSASKLADYFGVSMDYLLGRKPPNGADIVTDTLIVKNLTQIVDAVNIVQFLPQELMRLYGEVARLSAKLESLGEQNRELRVKNQELSELVASLRKQAKARLSLTKTGQER